MSKSKLRKRSFAPHESFASTNEFTTSHVMIDGRFVEGTIKQTINADGSINLQIKPWQRGSGRGIIHKASVTFGTVTGHQSTLEVRLSLPYRDYPCTAAINDAMRMSSEEVCEVIKEQIASFRPDVELSTLKALEDRYNGYNRA